MGGELTTAISGYETRPACTWAMVSKREKGDDMKGEGQGTTSKSRRVKLSLVFVRKAVAPPQV